MSTTQELVQAHEAVARALAAVVTESEAAERCRLSIGEFRAACLRHRVTPIREARRGRNGQALYRWQRISMLLEQMENEVADRRTFGEVL